MSITPELRASARATYRLLFRTAANTFQGDDRVLNAFREKVRTDFREGRSLIEATAYNARIQLGREVAEVLRKNIVQGVKVDQRSSSSPASEPNLDTTVQDGSGIWRLRLTKDTELGSNESLKSGPSLDSSRTSGGRQGCCQSSSSSSAASSFPLNTEQVTMDAMKEHEEDQMDGEEHEIASQTVDISLSKRLNFSALKRVSKNRVQPILNEEDLEESFVRGSGPGGQSINKTSNNVQLLHKPTSIRVTCQETRSLQTNRMIARKNLLEKLDRIANPGLSKEDLKRAKQIERERRRRKKAKKKARAKAPGEAQDEEE